MKNTVLIMCKEAELAAAGQSTIDDRLRAAMKATCRHYLGGTVDERLKAALTGAMAVSNDDDKERIKQSADALAEVQRAMHGGEVDPTKFTPNTLPLLRLWEEAKSA
jgi:hypothetical protein